MQPKSKSARQSGIPFSALSGAGYALDADGSDDDLDAFAVVAHTDILLGIADSDEMIQLVGAVSTTLATT